MRTKSVLSHSPHTQHASCGCHHGINTCVSNTHTHRDENFPPSSTPTLPFLYRQSPPHPPPPVRRRRYPNTVIPLNFLPPPPHPCRLSRCNHTPPPPPPLHPTPHATRECLLSTCLPTVTPLNSPFPPPPSFPLIFLHPLCVCVHSIAAQLSHPTPSPSPTVEHVS